MDANENHQGWLQRIGASPAADPGAPAQAGQALAASEPDADRMSRPRHADVVDLDPPETDEAAGPPDQASDSRTSGKASQICDEARSDLTPSADAAVCDDDSQSVDPDDSPPARRFTPWVAGAFGAAVVTAVLITAVGTSLLGAPAPTTPEQPNRTSMVAHPVSPAPLTSTTPDTADQPLPFIATADCPAGSTPAQSIADPDKPTPWICIRHTDGQPLSIVLGPSGMEHSYVITAVVIVPGDITPAQGSATEPWLQHRVVTRLQWQFNDPANTVLTQNTGNVHGEAVLPVPRINASRITVLIQETSRPPVATPAPTPASGPGQIFGDILSPQVPAGLPDPVLAGGDGQQPDPSDTTFAVTSIKIIGHKAL